MYDNNNNKIDLFTIKFIPCVQNSGSKNHDKNRKKYSSGCGQISLSILKSHNEFSFAFQVSEVELCACVCVQKKSVILGLVLNWYFFCR